MGENRSRQGRAGGAQHRVSPFLLAFATLLAGATAYGQDKVRYLDQATHKEATATGVIAEETPAQVVVKLGTAGGTKAVSATDILDITYDASTLPGSAKLDYGRAGTEEKKASDPAARDADRQQALGAAIKSYQEILPKLADDKFRFARRHLEYKIARLLARSAEDEPGRAETALEALGRFLKEHSDGWQVTACARLLARLQLAQGDAVAAEKTYDGLAAVPGLPDEVKDECALLSAEAMIFGRKPAEAERKLQVILHQAPPDSPRAARARVFLAECLAASGKLPEAVQRLRALIQSTPDRDLKALAYNALGDSYRLAGQPREALWPYLWVDVIYHQDKQEHIKAMLQLVRLFDEQGDKARAKQYRDRLRKEE
jgi:tetratricopeptide (TPR) repeat protein